MDPLLLSAAGLLLLNVVVSVKVGASRVHSWPQKAVQIAIIWLLPVLGGLVVYLVHRTDEEPRGRTEDRVGRGHDGMPGGTQ